MSLQPGQRVRLVRVDRTHPFYGREGVVREREDTRGRVLIRVDFDGVTARRDYKYFEYRFDVVDFDLKKGYVCRGGHKVANAKKTKKGITATVQVAGQELILHYDLSGRFYGKHECPIDLVNP